MQPRPLIWLLVPAFLHVNGLRRQASAGESFTGLANSSDDGAGVRSKRQGLKDACYKGDFSDPSAKSCLKDQRLFFLHIPKAAGTTIEQVAVRSGVRWGRYMDSDNCYLGGDRCWPSWHTVSALMNNVNVYSDTTVFCSVRNPFTRALSEYKHAAKHPNRFTGREIMKEHGPCSTVALNKWLTFIIKRIIAGYAGINDCFLIPQAYHIWGPPDAQGEQCQYCHEIIRTEEFPNSFNSLMERYNYSMRIKNNEHVNRGGCDALSVRDLEPETIKLIQRVYSDDFRMLNYSTNVSEAQ